MARLPNPGGDDGQWGNLLNDFLLVSHLPDGSLHIADIVAAKYVKPSTGIPKTDLSDDVQAALDTAMSGVAPDASPTVKGLVRLSGDLTGDSLSPLIGVGKITGGTGGSIATGTITNDNLHASANIAKSKLAPLALTNDDIAVGAAIVQSKIVNLASDLASKASVSHAHAISDVTNLQTSLDSKAASSHSHTASDIASGTLAIGRIPTGTTGSTVALGDHAHSNYAAVSHGHAIADTTGLQGALDTKAASVHGHAISEVTNLQSVLDDKSDDGHGHAITEVTNLQTVLDSKAATVHTHSISSTTGLQTALDAKTAIGHGHVIADTSGLQGALDGKAATTHSHSIANVTNLQDSLDAKSDDGHGHAIADVSNLQSSLDGKAATSHVHTIAHTTGLQTALDGKSATGHVHAVADTTGLQTALDNKSNTGHTHLASNVTDLTESVADIIGDKVTAGANISVQYDSGTGLTTISSTVAPESGEPSDTVLSVAGRTGDVVLVAGDIASGTFGSGRIPNLDAAKVTTGTFDIGRIPTGTSAVTVALGNHAHAGYALVSHDHEIDDVTNLQTALDGKSNTGHGHAIADTTGLQTALDGKAATSHSHTIANTTGLQTILDIKAAASHSHTASDITAGTIDIARVPTGTTGTTVALGNHAHSNYSTTGHAHVAADVTDLQDLLDNKSDTAHTHTVNDVANLQASLNAKADTAHDHSIANVTGLQSALDAKSATSHTHTAANTTSGTFDIARIPTGSTGTTVALGNHAHTDYAATSHAHAAADVTSGTFDIARIPTGTTGSTVSLGNHGHTIANVTNLQATLDAKAASVHTHDDRYYTESEVDAALSAKINTAEKGAANGLATLGADSKIPANQLPSLAIKDTFTVASQSAMLALTAERGDMAIRTDNGDTFVLASDSPSTLGDWKKLTNGYTSPVASVAGKTGAVTLVKGDVGLGNVDNTSDANKPISTLTQTALDAKAATSHTHTIANVTNLQTTLDAKIAATEKAAASGVATLDSGTKVPIAQIPTGTTSTTVSLGDHTHTGFAATTHVHAGTDITSGTIAIARIPTGTTSTTVSLGNHAHAATSITSGTLAIARLPTGTTSTTVSLGDHTHTGYAATVHTHAISDTTNLQTTLDAKIAATEKGANSGVATLGSDGKVPTAQLPTAAVTSVAGKTGAVTLVKGDVGLGNVDNTSDLSKPISTATQTALNGKASVVINPVNESSYPDGTIFLYTV